MSLRAFLICMSMPIVLTLRFSSCDKPEYPTYYLETDFTDYLMFSEGSYWVYNQEGNSNLDSIHLHTNVKRMNETRRAYAFNYEEFFQNMSSSFYKDILLGSGGAERYDGKNVFFVYTEGFLSNAQERNLQFFTGHLLGTNLQLTESVAANYVDSLGTYTVNGHQYRDVKVFENTVFRGPLMTARVYYARGVGVIRKELVNGQVWNLLRYKVNR